MLRLVIVDWDGTIADSVTRIIAGKQFLAEKYDLKSPSPELVREVLGTQFELALHRCFPDASILMLKDMAADFYAYMQKDENQPGLFPGAVKALQDLKKQHVPIALATSKSREELDKALSFHGIEELFDFTGCAHEYAAKPDPALLEHILRQFKVKPEESMMIGDTTTDGLFARNAGVPFMGVTFGAHTEKSLKALHPYALMSDWNQLLGLLYPKY